MRFKTMVKCSNCEKASPLNKGRCYTCSCYFRRNGKERPLNLINNKGRNHRYMTLEEKLTNPTYRQITENINRKIYNANQYGKFEKIKDW